MAARVNCVLLLDVANRVHLGHDDLVTGKVQVTCHPGSKTTSLELFGPLRIVLTFSGRSKSKIWVSNGQSTTVHRGRAPLFHKNIVIYDEPFRGDFGKTYTFPFTLQFPDSVELGDGVFSASEHSGFLSFPGHPLPPSMAISARGYRHHFECFVAYAVNANASMPGIQADFNPITELTVLYSPDGALAVTPAPLPLPSVRRICIVQNKALLPEEERPKGFKQNAKALFSSDYYPKFVFNAYAKLPDYLQIGEQPKMQIRITPEPEQSNVASIPTVEIKYIAIKIKGQTAVRAERAIWRERSQQGSETMYVNSIQVKNAMFRKETDWTLDIAAKALPTSLQPSFATYNIARQYELDIDIRLTCATQEFELRRRYILPILPYTRASINGQGEAGSSHAASAPTYMADEQLPSYQGSSSNALLAAAPVGPASTTT